MNDKGKRFYNNEIRPDFMGLIFTYFVLLPIIFLGFLISFFKNPKEFFQNISEIKKNKKYINNLSEEELEYYNPSKDAAIHAENNKNFEKIFPERNAAFQDGCLPNPIAESLYRWHVVLPFNARKIIQESIRLYRKNYNWK